MNSGVPNTQSLSIDTTLSNARSMPTTPATTPPGSNMQGMQSYQSQSGYDSSKSYYSAAPPSHPHYAPQQPLAQPMAPYGQTMPANAYIKNDMAPPSARATGGPPETEQADVKPDRYSQNNGHVGNGANEPVTEHEPEYVQHDSAGYNASRGSYTYTTNPSVGSLAGDHSQLASDMTGSPSQQNGSGRMTPRTSGGPPPQWASGYNTPPRPTAASSLYNIVSDTRGAPNGATSDNYSVASNPASGYSTGMNGALGSGKRLREDDDVDQIVRPDSRGTDYDSKRRKTLTEATVGGPVGGVPLGLQPMKAGGVMSRRR
jgi:protein SOK2